MTETGRDVVERLRELLGVVVDADTPEERDEAWNEIEQRYVSLFAVVEAAQNFVSERQTQQGFLGPHWYALVSAVEGLHSQASDEGNQ